MSVQQLQRTKYGPVAPCALCPFRRDVPVYLRVDRRRGIVESLREGAAFWCHKTVDYDTDDEPSVAGAQECAGAVKMLQSAGGSTQLSRIAERLGARIPDETTGAAVWTVDEFQHVPEGAVDSGDSDGEYAPGAYQPPTAETCSVSGSGCGDPVCEACADDDGRCQWCSDADAS